MIPPITAASIRVVEMAFSPKYVKKDLNQTSTDILAIFPWG
jgi:hypothetical protein